MKRTSRVYYPKTTMELELCGIAISQGAFPRSKIPQKWDVTMSLWSPVSTAERGSMARPSHLELATLLQFSKWFITTSSVSKPPFPRSSTHTLTLLQSSAGTETTSTLAFLQPCLCRLLLGAPRAECSVNTHQWPLPTTASGKNKDRS